MIRVTIELLPFGDLLGRKTLAVMDIANDGTGDHRRGSYKARRNPKLEWEEKVVENYPRQSYPVTKLVYLALKHFYEKKHDS